jgi:superfamily II DNA or RNA helicase
VTVSSCIVAFDNKYTLVTLPTGGGKTFIIGLLASYYQQLKKKNVVVMVPSEDLKRQMINQLGRIGRHFTIKTTKEYMLKPPATDLLIIDEVD